MVVGIELGDRHVSPAWSIEALVLLWSGFRLGSPAIRWGALVLLGLAGLRWALVIPVTEPHRGVVLVDHPAFLATVHAVINRDVYAFMEWAAPFLVLWSFAFTLITTVRIVLRVRQGIARVPDSMVFTELAGLPLTLLKRAGSLFVRPADATLLRNMMYFTPRGR